MEEHIAEGDELKGGLDAEQTADTRSRCKIVQISLFDGPLAQYGVRTFEKTLRNISWPVVHLTNG